MKVRLHKWRAGRALLMTAFISWKRRPRTYEIKLKVHGAYRHHGRFSRTGY